MPQSMMPALVAVFMAAKYEDFRWYLALLSVIGIALAMVLSSLSDLIQFAYFRATHGKRFFKMAPLHHHFELSGMPETSIVAMYYITTAVLCLIALLGFVA